MTSTELKTKWSGLSDNTITSGFRSLRIASDCFCELFIGVSKDNRRCLILALPENKRLDFRGIQKENLSIDYFQDKNLIVLQLIDNTYHDLFDDLVISLYQGIKDIIQVDEYSNYFIQTFYRWTEFFEDKKSELLSEDVIRGFMGELLVLKSLLNAPVGPSVNFILNSWKGPYDKGNDFELEVNNLEVKTKSPSGIDITVSSEYQLEVSSGKGLELIVISLLSDFNDGITIRDLIFEIKNIVQMVSGDIAILWKALSQKNITSRNVSDYDKYKFRPVSSISYNCASNDFPKLNRSNIPDEINTLQYNLRTNLLIPFIIEQRDF